MKITTNLPQFRDKPTLIVTSGSHHALVYFALDGEIEQLHELRHDTPTYSDNEGMFKNGPGAGGFGGVLESKKHKATRDLSKELSKIMFEEVSQRRIQQVYLFVDPRMKGMLDSDMHSTVRPITLMTFDGNYTFESPVGLVSHIARRREERNRMRIRGEAHRLLEKMRYASVPRA